MISESTQQTAQQQLYRALIRTLRTLPVGTSLSLSHPDLPHAQLHSGVTLPIGDPATAGAAEFFDIAYWVTGPVPHAAGGFFELIVRSWNRFGWPTRTDRDNGPPAAYTRTPGRVGLAVRESVGGYVSLSGSTPPFVPGSAAGPPLPESIEHPLVAPATSHPAAGSPRGSRGDRRSRDAAGPVTGRTADGE